MVWKGWSAWDLPFAEEVVVVRILTCGYFEIPSWRWGMAREGVGYVVFERRALFLFSMSSVR